MLLASTLQHSRPHSRCVPGHIHGVFLATFKVCFTSHHCPAARGPQGGNAKQLAGYHPEEIPHCCTVTSVALGCACSDSPCTEQCDTYYTTPSSDDTGQR